MERNETTGNTDFTELRWCEEKESYIEARKQYRLRDEF
jgi:hypothetical protein